MAEQPKQVGKMTADNNKTLTRFGFNFDKGGAHSARTMMLQELSSLLSYVDDPKPSRTDYVKAIEDDNCLGKRSAKTRVLTGRHLSVLYALDPSVALFRALLYFWNRDADGRPLLALLCAYSRDALLRMSCPVIQQAAEGSTLSREALEEFIEDLQPGRFSQATLKSTAQNINSTWTQSGHVSGRIRKIRGRTPPTPGAVAYALFLGYLAGARGTSLFQTEYAKLLDCSSERAMDLAEDASRRGWIVFKRIGDVMEVLFPNLLTAQEMEWIREQN